MKRPPSILIRRSTASEWQALRNLRLRALEFDPLAFGSTLTEEKTLGDERWRERAAKDAESLTSAKWVAEDALGRLVGSVVIAQVEGKVYVFGMWVEPQFRGRGLGARLLETGLTWARSTFPGQTIRLDVNPRQTAAIRLYESHGFRRSAEDRPLGHTGGETRYEMILLAPKSPSRESTDSPASAGM